MPLVPYVTPAHGMSEVAERILARRGPSGLLEIDQTMLNCEPMAHGYNELLARVRGAGVLTDDVRELLILRTTYLLDASYEYKPHESIGRAAGLSAEQVLFTRHEGAFDGEMVASVYPELRLALAYELAEQSTLHIKISEDLGSRLKSSFTDAELVAAFTTVAAYNFTSRLVVGMDVGSASHIKAGLL